MSGISQDHQREKIQPEAIRYRPIKNEDMELLYRLYASTRLTEMSVTGWDKRQMETFLRMQLKLQHMHYMRKYPNASFSIVCIGGTPAGRLYVDRTNDGMRIIDIALLPEFRKKGAEGCIMRGLVNEADKKGLVMTLHIEKNNPILPFYKTLGFKEIEVRGVHYYMERKATNSTTSLRQPSRS